MNPKSVVWCLWIISLNSLCCCGRSEHHKFMNYPKIHSKSLHGPRDRSQFNQKYTLLQEMNDYNFYNNEKTKKSEKQLLMLNTTEQDTYPINKLPRSVRRFKRDVLNDNLRDKLNYSSTIFSPNKQLNVSRKNRATRNMALVQTQNVYQKPNSSQNHYDQDGMARNNLYYFSNRGETEDVQEIYKQNKEKSAPTVSNRYIWIEEQDHTTASPTSYNESEVPSDNETFIALIEQFKRLYPISLWKESGWFEEDYLYIINAHWLQFPPPSKASHYTLAVVYIFVLTAGISGNALVIFMFFKCRSLRTPANILVFNLAISDFLMIAKMPVFIYNSIFLGPALGKTACTIYGFVGGLSGTVSIGTLAAIAFDRYSVVVYPLEPLRSISGLRAKLSVVLVWMYGIFFAIIPALDIGLGRYVPEGYLTSCSFDYLSEDRNAKIFIFAFFCAAWILPFVIIFFCYAKILQVVIATRNVGRKVTGSISSRHCKEQEKMKTELKLAGIVICVIGLFFAAWTPYSIVSLMGISGYKHKIKPIISMIPAMCAKLASCVDPFVYVVTHPKFRQECENLLLSKKEQHRRSTVRQGWSVDQQNHRNTIRDGEITSEDGVEVVEMSKVPYGKEQASVEPISTSIKRGKGHSVTPVREVIRTISSHTITKGIDIDQLPKTIDGNEDLQPPTWFVKPDFVQRPNSIKRVVQKMQRMKSTDSMTT